MHKLYLINTRYIIIYDPAIAGCPKSSLLRMQIDISKVKIHKVILCVYPSKNKKLVSAVALRSRSYLKNFYI
jgi:hypothetical protein